MGWWNSQYMGETMFQTTNQLMFWEYMWKWGSKWFQSLGIRGKLFLVKLQVKIIGWKLKHVTTEIRFTKVLTSIPGRFPEIFSAAICSAYVLSSPCIHPKSQGMPPQILQILQIHLPMAVGSLQRLPKALKNRALVKGTPHSWFLGQKKVVISCYILSIDMAATLTDSCETDERTAWNWI